MGGQKIAKGKIRPKGGKTIVKELGLCHLAFEKATRGAGLKGRESGTCIYDLDLR